MGTPTMQAATEPKEVKVSTVGTAVVPRANSRAKPEWSIGIILSIVLGVYPMNIWIKGLLLVVLCCVFVDLVCSQTKRNCWRIPWSLGVICVIAVISWRILYPQYLTEYSSPISFSAKKTGFNFQENSMVYGIKWKSGYEDIRVNVANNQDRFGIEHLDIYVTLDGNAVEMKTIENVQGVWIRPSPILGDVNNGIVVNSKSIVVGTSDGTSIPIEATQVATNRYRIIYSDRLSHKDDLDFIVVGIAWFGKSYPNKISITGTYDLVDGQTRVQKMIDWHQTF